MTEFVDRLSVGHTQPHDGSVLPFALQVNFPTLKQGLAWIIAQKEELLARAEEHGAVLLRGLPVTTAEDFDAVVATLQLANFPYAKSLSNAVRLNRTERVFTANEAPPDVEIFLHHEMAQTPIFPTRIFFCCLEPPTTGGATPICRSDLLLIRLESSCPEFVQRCRERGLKYSNVMPSENDLSSGMGRSWQSTLAAQSREQAEARLRELNYTWTWQADGCLRATTPVLPAVHSLDFGREVFFNQLIAAFCGWKDSRNDPSKAIRHGDDSPLDANAVRRASEIAYEIAFDIAWQRGDVALLDNRIVMHGRRPFSGSRSVLASLAMAECQPA